MESSLTETLDLIDAVQKRQALYDKTDGNYSRNRMYLNKQWKEIGDELGIDGNTARIRWTALRDYFQRLHKPVTATSRSRAERKRKWYLYDAMQFLLPYISVKKTCSDLSDSSENGDNSLSQISEASFHSSDKNVTSFPQPDTSALEVDKTPSQINSSEAATSTYRRRKRKAEYPQKCAQTASLDE